MLSHRSTVNGVLHIHFIFTHTTIHARTHTQRYTHVHTHTYNRTYTHSAIHARTHAHIQSHIHARTHALVTYFTKTYNNNQNFQLRHIYIKYEDPVIL